MIFKLIIVLGYTLFMVMLNAVFFFASYSYKIKHILPRAKAWAGVSSNRLLGLNNKLIGSANIPNQKLGYVSVSNHQSYLDILLILSKLGHPFLLKSSLLFTPFGWGAVLSGSITVNRGKAGTHMKVINRLIQIAQKHTAMHLFPEGTRSKDGTLGKFKQGSLKMLYRRKLDVLPCGIWGNHLTLGKQSLKFNPSYPVILSVGKLIKASEFSTAEEFISEIITQTKQQVLESKSEFEKIT